MTSSPDDPAPGHPLPEHPLDAALARFDALSRAMLLVRAAASPPWADLHVTVPQLRVVGLLCGSERGLSGRELAGLLGVGPSAVTPLVDRLVEHGYVRREEDRHDRRVTRVHLTEEGRALLQRLTAGRREHMADLLRRLDAEELAVVDRAFELLCRAAERSRADRPGTPGAPGPTAGRPTGPGADENGAAGSTDSRPGPGAVAAGAG